ncbi:hypothetical protein [Amycolatopsis minnesotensis]|uniref:Uncharacterized protein n=1 Tax=Amycolatopsis minnesotensis TaxID=337894 RepID=A0ABN2SB96_9PSEU
MTTDATALPLEDLHDELRRWSATHSPGVRAAVELLIEHDRWLRHEDFRARAVKRIDYEEMVVISWPVAQDMLDDGLRASTSELAVLDFALALAQDRFRWASMGLEHCAMLLHAAQTALGAR